MSQSVAQSHNSPNVEHNLHDMLRDAPVMNDSCNAVHSGTAVPTPQRGYSHPTSLPLTNTNCKYFNTK